MQIKTKMRYHSCQNGYYQMTTNKCWQGFEEMGMNPHARSHGRNVKWFTLEILQNY